MWSRLKAKLRGCRKSLTARFNIFAGSALLALPYIQENLPQLQEYMSPDVYRYLMGCVVLVNLALRFKTDRPLEEK